MVCMIIKKCHKCRKDFTGALERYDQVLCGECRPTPPPKFVCPGCCICKGGWVPQSERKY